AHIYLLTGHVAVAVLLLRRVAVAAARGVALERALDGDLERRVDPDRDVPAPVELGPHQEHAVEQHHCVAARRARRLLHARVDTVIERGRPERALRTHERLEQNTLQRRVVERVEVVTLGRVRAARVAHAARVVEAVDRRADDLAPRAPERRDELVGERRLARAVYAVERDASRMIEPHSGDRGGELADAGGARIDRHFDFTRLPSTEASARRPWSDQTGSSLPLGSLKWKRRPPGNGNGFFTIVPPAARTVSSVASRSRE